MPKQFEFNFLEETSYKSLYTWVQSPASNLWTVTAIYPEDLNVFMRYKQGTEWTWPGFWEYTNKSRIYFKAIWLSRRNTRHIYDPSYYTIDEQTVEVIPLEGTPYVQAT